MNSQSQYERPTTCDPLTAQLASWTSDYNAAVSAFIAGPFAAARVQAKLTSWSTQIAAAVAEIAGLNSAPSLLEWQYAMTQLQSTIDRARAHRGYAY